MLSDFSTPRRSHRAIHLAAKGASMGVAELIPGISGGTIALVVGIYAELIDAIKAFSPRLAFQFICNIFVFWNAQRRQSAAQLARVLRLPFLLPLAAGFVSAILVASYIIPRLLIGYPQQTKALILGLVLTSIYIPLSLIPKHTLGVWTTLLVCVWIAYTVVGLPHLDVDAEKSLYFTFFSGAIAACAMLLPGISGSYTLQALGQYEFVLDSLRAMANFDTNAIAVVMIFMAGIILGITSFVRIISWALHHYYALTLAALSGLMIGALRVVWPFKDGETVGNVMPSSFGTTEIICLGLFLLGVLITTILIVFDRRSQRISR